MDDSRKLYWDTVEELAEIVLEGVEDQDRSMPDVLHEKVDGSSWVFDHNKSLKTILYSNSDPNDHWKHEDHWRDAISYIAYDCLKKDVRNKVRELKNAE